MLIAPARQAIDSCLLAAIFHTKVAAQFAPKVSEISLAQDGCKEIHGHQHLKSRIKREGGTAINQSPSASSTACHCRLWEKLSPFVDDWTRGGGAAAGNRQLPNAELQPGVGRTITDALPPPRLEQVKQKNFSKRRVVLDKEETSTTSPLKRND